MSLYLNDKGYICYIRSGVDMSLTHGGKANALLHKREIEEICNDIVDQKLERFMQYLEKGIDESIQRYGEKVWNELISSLKSSLEEDIVTEVSIGIDNAREIICGTKTETYLRKHIEKSLNKELSKLKQKVR